MTIDERIKHAEQRRQESFGYDSLQGISYWDGYIAALKAIKEESRDEIKSDQIIKAMGCCYTDDENCLTCPYINDYASCVGLTKNALALLKHNNNEIADWKEIAEQYQRQFEEAKSDTLREIQNRLAQYIGTYTDKSFVYVSAMFKLIDRIANEILEGEG